MKSPFRDDYRIPGFYFGNGDKTVAIVGAMRGNEVQQLFICSQLVKNLIALEGEGKINPNVGILVIPTVNPYSLNIHKRFWAMDNTDINRMFPGYDQGETTQRIAAALFEAVKGYEYGIQLSSYYLNGNFVPHVRVMDTGYQDLESADSFGLPFVYEYEPKPYDTTLLNYNWQIFETKAFSVYGGSTDVIDKTLAKQTWMGILRFLDAKGIINKPMHGGMVPFRLKNDKLCTVVSRQSGILYPRCDISQNVKKGDLLAEVLSPYMGETLDSIYSPVTGTVFFAHHTPLIHQHSRIFQIVEYIE